jgi:hypothetical protein
MSEYYGTAIIPARVRKPRDYHQNQIIIKKARWNKQQQERFRIN